jgi:hypothetical protein
MPLMAGRLDEGLRSEIKGEIKAWSEDLTWHLEVGGWAVWLGQRWRVAMVGRRGRKGMELTGEPHMAVMWERDGASARVRKVEENMPFGKYANAAWAEWAKWAERTRGGLWAKRPDLTSFQAESDKFWGGENGQVAKSDKFCSDEKWTSSEKGQVLSN